MVVVCVTDISEDYETSDSISRLNLTGVGHGAVVGLKAERAAQDTTAIEAGSPTPTTVVA